MHTYTMTLQMQKCANFSKKTKNKKQTQETPGYVYAKSQKKV